MVYIYLYHDCARADHFLLQTQSEAEPNQLAGGGDTDEPIMTKYLGTASRKTNQTNCFIHCVHTYNYWLNMIATHLIVIIITLFK